MLRLRGDEGAMLAVEDTEVGVKDAGLSSSVGAMLGGEDAGVSNSCGAAAE
jgi:hypothetical protein